MNLNYENKKRLWLSVSFTLRNSTHKASLLCIVGCNNDIECVGKQILKNRLDLTLSVWCFGHFGFLHLSKPSRAGHDTHETHDHCNCRIG